MPSNKSSLDISLEIINKAIESKTTVKSLCKQQKKSQNYVLNIINSLDEQLDSGAINKKQYNKIKTAWEKYLEAKKTFPKKEKIRASFSASKSKAVDYDSLNDEEKEESEYDAWGDDKYDNRSKGSIIRDDNNEITGYSYKILIKGEPDLTGELTREEMDMVYRLYSNLDGAGLTLRAVSRHFRHLTYRDFKRILRAFNITKQSIPVAPHVIEENSDDKVQDIIFRNKENNLLKKLDDERGRKVENILKETQKELIELKSSNHILKEAIEDLDLESIKPYKIEEKEIEKEKAMIVYLSDQHVGAHTKEDSMYENEYNEKIFDKRMQATLDKIQFKFQELGRFDKLIICNLGDCVDGFNGKTTGGLRGTSHHTLPQNMSNKEQYNVYVETTLRFFDTLHEMDVANSIEYYSVSDDNHSGDFGYAANKTLYYVFQIKYPDMKVVVFEKFIEHFTYGKHTFMLCHGKDKEDMNRPISFELNKDVEARFNEYMDNFNVSTAYKHVIVGDQHRSMTNFAKRFRYRRVFSMYGSSKWIHTNFGNTRAGVDYEIAYANDEDVSEGRIRF